MVTLVPLTSEDREQFILDNQRAFKYGALEEFGLRNDRMEEDGEIISRSTIEASLDAQGAEAYRILNDGEVVGGLILLLDSDLHEGELEILFVSPSCHSKGIGTKAWFAVENLHPEINKWTTYTPYFETRNIHFYVNRLGFHIVEFLHKGHLDPLMKYIPEDEDDMMFKFEKIIPVQDGHGNEFSGEKWFLCPENS